MSEFFIGEIANAKAPQSCGSEITEECGNGSYKKVLSSGREFNTSRLEKISTISKWRSNYARATSPTTPKPRPMQKSIPEPCRNVKRQKGKRFRPDLAKILADTGEALNCKELVAKAKETGWVSTGKTPEQTLYSGIFREIKEKGEASRFKKSATRKGSFEANA